MSGLVTYLQGKKTYLVLVAGLITALVTYLNGNMEIGEFVKSVFAIVTGMTLRDGISKKGS